MVRRGMTILGLVALLVAVELAAEAPGGVVGGSWYFAVSGDSRDCGDLIMPKIDGGRVCRYLREDPRFQQIPIVIFSALAAREVFKALAHCIYLRTKISTWQ